MNKNLYGSLGEDFMSRIRGVTLLCPTEEERNIASTVFNEMGYFVEDVESNVDPKKYGLRVERRDSS